MLPITFSTFVAPAFNSEIINIYCKLIDQLEAKQLKCNDEKRQLLHFMSNSVDISVPSLKKQYEKYFIFVKESIR